MKNKPASIFNIKTLCKISILVIAVLLFNMCDSWAEGISIDFGKGGSNLTTKLVQFVFMITIFSIAPSILLMVTSFTRLIIVFSFLRSAIGLQQSPPNQILIGLSLFLTAFIMAPTFEKAYQDGVKPYMQEKLKEEEAFSNIIQPFHKFMREHVREKEVELFGKITKMPLIEKIEDLPFKVLIPAFMISELKRGFEIGFLLFLPFLVIDMVIASILMSMGMMMLPPMMVSLPFKIIFFVLIDGWVLLTKSLVSGFG